MTTFILILQILLALAFLTGGAMKLVHKMDRLSHFMPWVNEYPVSTVRFIGTSEVLGAIGLILPWWTNIFPVLTPLAAGLLSLVMVLAGAHHLRRKEYREVGVNVVLFVLLITVCWFRFQPLH